LLSEIGIRNLHVDNNYTARFEIRQAKW
jgi:hypothetical protein